MNSILAGGAGGGSIADRFREFSKGMTPDGAKARVEQMLASGQVSSQQFEAAKAQAQALASALGIK